MPMKAQLEEIIRELPQGVIRGWKGSIERNNSICKKGVRPDMILTRGLPKGNKPCLISLTSLIAVIKNESWRIYESTLRI